MWTTSPTARTGVEAIQVSSDKLAWQLILADVGLRPRPFAGGARGGLGVSRPLRHITHPVAKPGISQWGVREEENF